MRTVYGMVTSGQRSGLPKVMARIDISIGENPQALGDSQ
jgi:hypothetical protein